MDSQMDPSDPHRLPSRDRSGRTLLPTGGSGTGHSLAQMLCSYFALMYTGSPRLWPEGQAACFCRGQRGAAQRQLPMGGAGKLQAHLRPEADQPLLTCHT